MSHALPPLNALRAFEAAARHANFARAAHELSVTPGALSHQVRGLEAALGVALFERQARGVALSGAGQSLAPALIAAFAQIRSAVDALRGRADDGVLVVSAPPGFTSKWLAPRLYRFAHAQPKIELRIAASAAYARFGDDGVDLALRNIAADHPRDAALDYEKLLDDDLIAVCSPKLLAASARGRGAEALRRLALIHDDQLAGRPEMASWADWFRAAALAPPDLRRGLRFNSAEHAIEAALQGAGLLLTHRVLVDDELRSGRLAMPRDVALPIARAYFLVRPLGRALRPEVEAFRTWLRREIKPVRRARAAR